MKKWIFAILIGLLGTFAAAAQEASEPQPQAAPALLRQVYERIAALDGFEPFSAEEASAYERVVQGKCHGTVHGNSSHRDEVLQILSTLPASALYSEEVTDKGKVSRYYIATGSDGSSSMLYAFVGFGGNDLLVLLFEGGDLAKYREQADKIK